MGKKYMKTSQNILLYFLTLNKPDIYNCIY